MVQQCQKALNDISTQNLVRLYWISGHAGLWGNEIADKLVRDHSVQKFVQPVPSLGDVQAEHKNKDKKLGG